MKHFEPSLKLLFQIGVLIHNFNKRSEKILGLSFVQWCLLKQLIDMPSSSAQALAKAVGVHPSTLTQTLKRLQRKELIFITDDPRDSRRKLIAITRTGKETLELAQLKMGEWQAGKSMLEQTLSQAYQYLQTLPKRCKVAIHA